MLIQSILLQESIKIPGTSFSAPFKKRLRELNDWRINEYLELIGACDRRIADIDARLDGMLKKSPGAQLLKTMPGVGTFTAIAVDSALGDASRFLHRAHPGNVAARRCWAACGALSTTTGETLISSPFFSMSTGLPPIVSLTMGRRCNYL